MVGKGVLLECLDSPKIESVLVVNRTSINMQHPKLKEVLLADFEQIDTLVSDLKGFDGCFYCMGVSSIGMNETNFTKITSNTTKAFVDTLFELNKTREQIN